MRPSPVEAASAQERREQVRASVDRLPDFLRQVLVLAYYQGLRYRVGTLYPALYRLERQGLIRSDWKVTANNRRARYYALTKEGRRYFAEELAHWRRLSRAINLVLEAS